MQKTEELINNSSRVLDLHFFYMEKIKIYYKNRDNDLDALDNAIKACEQQIEIARKAKIAFIKEDRKLGFNNIQLPRHSGFEQLAIIEEKRKNFESAIEGSNRAMEQGWAGDWEKQIERCKKKLIQ